MKTLRKTLISLVMVLTILFSMAMVTCISSAMLPAIPTGVGDLNGSGEPNSADVLMILQFVVGKFYLTNDQQVQKELDDYYADIYSYTSR